MFFFVVNVQVQATADRDALLNATSKIETCTNFVSVSFLFFPFLPPSSRFFFIIVFFGSGKWENFKKKGSEKFSACVCVCVCYLLFFVTRSFCSSSPSLALLALSVSPSKSRMK